MMTVFDIEEITEIGHPKIKYDENGVPRGISVEEFSNRLLGKLSIAYGTDFRTLQV